MDKGNGVEGFGIGVLDAIQNEDSAITKVIREIEQLRNRTLLCYHVNFEHPMSAMVRADEEIIEVLLKSVDLDKYSGAIDFMIHSPGGEPTAAERFVATLRSYGTSLEVIIPKSAMSAATLVALGADKLVMAATSEIGPIDPQIVHRERGIAVASQSAKSFIDAYEELVKEVREAIAKGEDPQPYLEMLLRTQQPAFIHECEKARNAAREVASDFLKRYMLKDKPDIAKEIVDQLSEVGEKTGHGRPIRMEKAISIGLKIDEIPLRHPLWNSIWELHMRIGHYINAHNVTKYSGCRVKGIYTRVGIKQM